MKKMTLLTLFLSIATLVSCSNQEQTSDEELTSVAAKTLKEQEPLYGLQVYYSSAEAEIKRLETLKTKLVAEQEKGNPKVLEQIESIQKEIGKLKRFNDYLMLLKPPKGPRGPRPPQPCFSTENNCDPIRKISSKTLIVLGNDLMVTNVNLKNQKNESIKMEYQPIEDVFGQPSLEISTEFKGEGVMYTTFKTEVVGVITIPTPIISQ